MTQTATWSFDTDLSHSGSLTATDPVNNNLGWFVPASTLSGYPDQFLSFAGTSTVNGGAAASAASAYSGGFYFSFSVTGTGTLTLTFAAGRDTGNSTDNVQFGVRTSVDSYANWNYQSPNMPGDQTVFTNYTTSLSVSGTTTIRIYHWAAYQGYRHCKFNSMIASLEPATATYPSQYLGPTATYSEIDLGPTPWADRFI